MMNFVRIILVGFLAACTSVGCKKESSDSQPKTANAPSEIEKQGRVVYMSKCIACHNMNPKISGGLGPDVAGSSLELLQARIRDGKYPEGYKPKRDTRVMVAMPDVTDADIQALHAFLNSPNMK
jgi:mono/diheme cytochrome c family protein